MTVHVKQKTDNDCALASIAMSVNCLWEDLWTQDDLTQIEGKGISDLDPWLLRAGYIRSEYKYVYTHGSLSIEGHELLWARRALVSIRSLNGPSNHLIYWDGKRVWDPQEGVEGKLYVKHLHSAVLSRVVLLN
jgi:hypothetical protein